MRSGAQTSSAPKRRAAVCWPGVLGDADQRRARRGLAHRRQRQQPDRAGADDRDVLAGLDVGDARRRAARRRAARRARRPRRTDRRARVCSCDSCATRPFAPAAAGVAAEAGLQARGDDAVGRVAAERDEALRALRARRQAADGAAERGLDDDALAAPRAGADLAHDLVAGDERRAGQRGQVQRRLAGEQREVGAADAGQASGGPAASPGRARAAGGSPRAPARPRRAGPRGSRRTSRSSACRSAPSYRGPLGRPRLDRPAPPARLAARAGSPG